MLSIGRPIRPATRGLDRQPTDWAESWPIRRGVLPLRRRSGGFIEADGRFFEQPAVDVERRRRSSSIRPSRSGGRPSPSCRRPSSRDGLPSSREEWPSSEGFLRFSPAACGFGEASCLFQREPACRSRHPASCSRRPTIFDGDGRLHRTTRRGRESGGRLSLENGGLPGKTVFFARKRLPPRARGRSFSENVVRLEEKAVFSGRTAFSSMKTPLSARNGRATDGR